MSLATYLSTYLFTKDVRVASMSSASGRRPRPAPGLGARRLPDEDTAPAIIERVNDLVRHVDPERRTSIRRWLSAHGYLPAIPVPLRAADAADFEALIHSALDPTDPEPEPGEPEPGPI